MAHGVQFDTAMSTHRLSTARGLAPLLASLLALPLASGCAVDADDDRGSASAASTEDDLRPWGPNASDIYAPGAGTNLTHTGWAISAIGARDEAGEPESLSFVGTSDAFGIGNIFKKRAGRNGACLLAGACGAPGVLEGGGDAAAGKTLTVSVDGAAHTWTGPGNHVLGSLTLKRHPQSDNISPASLLTYSFRRAGSTAAITGLATIEAATADPSLIADGTAKPYERYLRLNLCPKETRDPSTLDYQAVLNRLRTGGACDPASIPTQRSFEIRTYMGDWKLPDTDAVSPTSVRLDVQLERLSTNVTWYAHAATNAAGTQCRGLTANSPDRSIDLGINPCDTAASTKNRLVVLKLQ